MSSAQNIDIRAPLGGLFAVLGLMLAAYGLFASGSGGPSDLASGMNVNLWWGLTMLVFGVVLLLMARRAMSHPVPPHAHPHREE
jgi:membrane protein implicated in regulation of membrane protease activity